MPLKDGWDLSLAASGTTYRFMLYPHTQQPYRHYRQSLNAQAYTIAGPTAGLANLDPDVAFWNMNDWSGGEARQELTGQFIWSPNSGAMYDYSTGNTRLSRRVTAPPTRTDANIKGGLTATLGTAGYFATATGKLWFAANEGDATPAILQYTTDTSSWTSGEPVGANDGTAVPDSRAFFVTGMVGKGDYVYVSLSQSINMIGSGLHLRRITTGGTNALFSEAAAANDTKGMAQLQQYLYRWTGQKLSQYDTTGALPVTGTIVYSVGLDVDPSTVYAGLCATDNSIAMFWAKTGHTELHIYKGTAGAPVFTFPEGFTGRSIGFLLGSVFVAGTYDDGSAVAFGYNIYSGQPFEVGFIRRGTTVTPVSVSPGMGTQLLIGSSEGYVFVRDANSGALSYLDQVTTNGDSLLAVTTYQGYRVAAFRDNSNTRFRKSSWAKDTDVPANGTFTLDTGEWDFDLPMEGDKVLHGIHARSSALSATKTLAMYYSADDGSFVLADTKTSGTSHYFAVSTSTNTIKGGKYRFKFVGTGSSGSNAPIVYSVTPRLRNWNFVRKWDIAVRLGGSQGEHGTNEAPEALKVRNWLNTLMNDRTLVDFTNGCVTEPNGSPPSGIEATCIIEALDDFVDRRGTGWAQITLTDVSPT